MDPLKNYLRVPRVLRVILCFSYNAEDAEDAGGDRKYNSFAFSEVPYVTDSCSFGS